MTKKQARELLSEGNGKLHKSILIWNLPAGDGKSAATTGGTCFMECPGCYAIKAQRQYTKNVLPSRLKKLEASKTTTFMLDIIESIKTLKGLYVRIHESGDFYSQEYINKWYYIASSLPGVHFTAYTKQLERFDFSLLRSLENVTIINSLHNNKINYGLLEKKPLEQPLCPCGTSPDVKGCGWDCNLCYTSENKELLESCGLYFKQH